MQKKHFGIFALVKAFNKTLFSAPGTSTSSESSMESIGMGLSNGFKFGFQLDWTIIFIGHIWP